MNGYSALQIGQSESAMHMGETEIEMGQPAEDEGNESSKARMSRRLERQGESNHGPKSSPECNAGLWVAHRAQSAR